MTRYALYAAGFVVFAVVFFAMAYLVGAMIGLAFLAVAAAAFVAVLIYGSWRLRRIGRRGGPPAPRT